MSLEEWCKTGRSSVIVKEVKTNVRWRDELRHQPGPMDHPTQEEIGVPATESEEDRATATQCLESVSKAHHRSVQGYHKEGAREGMSERLRHGLQQRTRKARRQDHPTARDGSRGRGEGVRNVWPSIRRDQNQESQEEPPTRDQKPPQLQKKEMDHQTLEEDEEPRRAAETAIVAHKLWRHLSQKYTHLR